MRQASRQVIAASESDLKNNRLGLMSQAQMEGLEGDIRRFQAQMTRFVWCSIALAVAVTVVLVVLSFVRILLLPLAMVIELTVIGMMISMITGVNRFVQQLMLDREAETVRIITGRTSRQILQTHPFYYALRVEVQNYKVLNSSLLRQFTTGELYQLYVLPQAGVIIAAEKISEKQAYYQM